MTIRIEVTGDSLPEVADKLLALASQFHGSQSFNAHITQTVANKAEVLEDVKTRVSRKTKKAEVEPETEQEDVGNAASNADETTATTAAEPAEATAAGTEASTAPADAAPTLDFDKEVAPVVIDAVQRLGKPAVSALLSEFGVERASEVDPSLYGELVERLKAL